MDARTDRGGQQGVAADRRPFVLIGRDQVEV
jgi:hypothetical protein